MFIKLLLQIKNVINIIEINFFNLIFKNQYKRRRIKVERISCKSRFYIAIQLKKQN